MLNLNEKFLTVVKGDVFRSDRENWVVISHSDLDGIGSAVVAASAVEIVSGVKPLVYMYSSPSSNVTHKLMLCAVREGVYGIPATAEEYGPNMYELMDNGWKFNFVILDRNFPVDCETGEKIKSHPNMKIYWVDHHESSIKEFGSKYTGLDLEKERIFLHLDHSREWCGSTLALYKFTEALFKEYNIDDKHKLNMFALYDDLVKGINYWDTFLWKDDVTQGEVYVIGKMMGCYDKKRRVEDIYKNFINNFDFKDYGSVYAENLNDFVAAETEFNGELLKHVLNVVNNFQIYYTVNRDEIMVTTSLPWEYSAMGKEIIMDMYTKFSGKNLAALITAKDYSCTVYTSDKANFASYELAKHLEKYFGMSGGGGHAKAAGFQISKFVPGENPLPRPFVMDKLCIGISEFQYEVRDEIGMVAAN